MEENLRTSAAESSPADSGRWIGRVVIAVIVAEAIWGLIVSLTNNLVLPAMARIVEADAQSPLYLGKGDYNVPALFASVLELCFAGIVAVSLNAWLQRKPKLVRTKSVRLTPPVAQTRAPAASRPTAAAPTRTASAMPVQTKASVTPQPVAPSSATPSPTLPSSPSAPPSTSEAKPTKPKPPKEVFYNIVGEPLTSEDDESES
jgi:hypothetical protein